MQNVSEVFGQEGWTKGVFFVGRLRSQCLELTTLHDRNLFRFVLFFLKTLHHSYHTCVTK